MFFPHNNVCAMALIFISHSGNSEGLQPEDRPKQEFANGLRDALCDRLKNRPNIEVFLDLDQVGAVGNARQAILRNAIGCSAAVVIVSPAALRSPWVLQECTIFSIRHLLRDLPWIPVLIGVDKKQFRNSPLSTTGIDDQWIVDGSNGREADLPALLDQIEAKFDNQVLAEDPTLFKWLVEVSAAIEKLGITDVEKQTIAKMVIEGEPELFPDSCTNLAAYFLAYKDFASFLGVFERLRNNSAVSASNVSALGALLRFLYLPMQDAVRIVRTNASGRRFVLVRAAKPCVQRDYVHRATADVYSKNIHVINNLACDDESLIAELRRAVVRFPSFAERELERARNEEKFFLLQSSAVSHTALARLEQEFPKAIFVLGSRDVQAGAPEYPDPVIPSYSLEDEEYFVCIAEDIAS